VVEGLGAAQFAMDGAVDRLRAAANARERGETLPEPGFPGAPPPGYPSARTPVFPDGPVPGHLDTSTDDDTGFVDPDAFGPDGSPYSPEDDSPYSPGDASERPFPGRLASRPRASSANRAIVLAAADPANAYGAALPWPEPPTGAGHKPGRKAGSLVVLVDGELTLYMERGGKTLLAWPSTPDDSPLHDPCLRIAAEALAAAARAGSLGTVTVERVNGASALTSPFGTLLEGAGFHATPRGLRLRA
jgi:ATP-dependent Lhr-like helicase